MKIYGWALGSRMNYRQTLGGCEITDRISVSGSTGTIQVILPTRGSFRVVPVADEAETSRAESRLSDVDTGASTYSPVKMFLISLVTIFTAEVGIMFAIHYWFPNIDP